MITGWEAAGHMRTSLALDALEMAVSARLRAGQQVAGVIHHSDYAEVGVKPENLRMAWSGCAC
jgi:putative transposase